MEYCHHQFYDVIRCKRNIQGILTEKSSERWKFITEKSLDDNIKTEINISVMFPSTCESLSSKVVGLFSGDDEHSVSYFEHLRS